MSKYSMPHSTVHWAWTSSCLFVNRILEMTFWHNVIIMCIENKGKVGSLPSHQLLRFLAIITSNRDSNPDLPTPRPADRVTIPLGHRVEASRINDPVPCTLPPVMSTWYLDHVNYLEHVNALEHNLWNISTRITDACLFVIMRLTARMKYSGISLTFERFSFCVHDLKTRFRLF